MLNFFTEAKEAVVQKNKNLVMINQQYQVLGGMEEKIRNSKKELKDTEESFKNSKSRSAAAAEELAALELIIKKKKSELYFLDKEISEKSGTENRLKGDLKILRENLGLIEQKIEEKELVLNWVEKEIAKSPEEKMEDGISNLLSVLTQCLKLKEHSERYYTF